MNAEIITLIIFAVVATAEVAYIVYFSPTASSTRELRELRKLNRAVEKMQSGEIKPIDFIWFVHNTKWKYHRDKAELFVTFAAARMRLDNI